MDKIDLEKLLQTEEVQNNLELQKDLSTLLENNKYNDSISYFSSNLSTATYRYLLDNKKTTANELFYLAIYTEDANKHEQLLDLALANKVNFKTFHLLPESLIDLEKCLNHGLSQKQAMKMLLNGANSDLIESHIDLLITKGVDLKNIDFIAPNFTFEVYQFLLTKGLNPDAILHAALDLGNNRRFNESVEQALQKSIELAKFALYNGADVNSDYDGKGSPLKFVHAKELINVLVSYGAKCVDSNDEEIIENGLAEIIFNPESIFKKKYKNLDAPKALDAKIPYTIFHIWLTIPDNPKEIRDQDLKIALETKATFAKAPVTWEHLLLTTDKNLFPKTAKILEDNGIKLVSIYDYKDVLPSFDIIIDAIDQQKWGIASDTLRYSWGYEFGGVYADLNFNFKREVTDETHKYNFFTQEYDTLYIENYFFGVSPHHPIMEEVLTLVTRNIKNPPKYISSIKNQDNIHITDMATANPTFAAFYKQANKHGNIDVAYPKTNNTIEYSLMTKTLGENLEHISICDPDKWSKNFADATATGYFNDKCGLEIFTIGHDSTDGKTWVNE